MRRAFTLVELVIVILLLGILGGVAAPKALQVSDSAIDNGLTSTLATVRDAIDSFTSVTGRLPGADGNEATFKSDLAPYLREFPTLPVGPTAAQDDAVVMDNKLTPVKGENNPTEGWRYFYKTGVFIVNWSKPVKTDGSISYDDL
jgi:prepilin-type N-terminal cleavage/methylation domain-containing protein